MMRPLLLPIETHSFFAVFLSKHLRVGGGGGEWDLKGRCTIWFPSPAISQAGGDQGTWPPAMQL